MDGLAKNQVSDATNNTRLISDTQGQWVSHSGRSQIQL